MLIMISFVLLEKFIQEKACQDRGSVLLFAPSQHKRPLQSRRDKGCGVGRGWLATRMAKRTEVKKPVDETMITLHNLVSLLQTKAATRQAKRAAASSLTNKQPISVGA
ncbi:hypothetical protein [Cupriavidus sp. D39]|uniref:hypothetical protein n=2 Tax=Cupriavidus TaxID=106589 RepID=UPI0022709FAF|nr:hypothetical protein [Cupriavidus sp. D39]MCY0855620.1 hypothetical protein [Cupriavidus sp. D39]